MQAIVNVVFLLFLLSGCSMQNGFQGDLGKALEDVPAFNQSHGTGFRLEKSAWPAREVKGLILKDARFEGVHFQDARIAQSRFTNCEFDEVVFEKQAFFQVEFVGCRFNRCRFVATEFRQCRFQGGKFHGNSFLPEDDGPGQTLFDSLEINEVSFHHDQMKSVDFQSGIFRHAVFEGVRFESALFTGFEFVEPAFEGGTYEFSKMQDCRLVKPSSVKTAWSKFQFGNSVILDAQVNPVSVNGDMNFEASGATFINSNFDLSRLKGNFGLFAAENCTVSNFESRGGFGLVGKISQVEFKHIHAGDIDMAHGLDCENARFEDIQAGYAFLDGAKFKDCSMKDFTVHTFLRVDGADLSGLTFENAKLDAAAKFSGKGTPFESKRPF
jgi:uncharacterized protein YjbI with pentapeptide repeats